MATAFDPLSCAGAFDALRTELERELSRTAGEVEVETLLLKIGVVVAQAQRWALERGSHFDFVDPPPNCDAVHCILILRRLASDLRELARRDGLRVVNDNGSSGDV
jgi:hypothetical protein